MIKAVYRNFFATYGRQPGYWVGAALSTIRTIITRVVTVIILGQLVGHIAKGDAAGAAIFVWIFLGLALGATVLATAADLIAIYAENRTYSQLSDNYFKKLTGKDLAFYKNNQTGYLVSAYRQYLDSMMTLSRLLRGNGINTIVALLAPIVVLTVASPLVGTVAAVVILLQFIYVSWASKLAGSARAASHEIYRQLSGEVSDVVTNVVAFKSSGDHRPTYRRIRELSTAESAAFTRRRWIENGINIPRLTITNIGSAVAFLIIVNSSGGHLSAESAGLMVMTITYMWQLISVVDGLSELIAQHDDLVTKIYPNLKFMAGEDEKIKDPARPEKLPNCRGALAVNHVGFNYGNKKAEPTVVFTDVNLAVAAGERVGIVGLSGSGKSTLASLLMRFDDVTTGSITLDGVDIRRLRQDELHRHISYVPQEPMLFHRSIRDNLRYFAPDATDADMEAAARASHAHEFIMNLAQGYDTLVGERGVKLSGGQKQRVVIARAILKNAAVMIFDEATSALDSESEEIIQKALPEIIGRRTAIVIAHRLSTVAGLDRIIVMEDGAIIEQGSHAELVKLGGRYYSLWQKQTKS